jgi:hypothetical protein
MFLEYPPCLEEVPERLVGLVVDVEPTISLGGDWISGKHY